MIPAVNAYGAGAAGVATFRAGLVLLEQRRVAVIKILQLHPRNFLVDEAFDGEDAVGIYRDHQREPVRQALCLARVADADGQG